MPAKATRALGAINARIAAARQRALVNETAASTAYYSNARLAQLNRDVTSQTDIMARGRIVFDWPWDKACAA